MATNYPTSLDTATQQPSPSASDDLNTSGLEHDVVHTNHSGALIQLETKLGIGASAAADASDGHVMTRQADGSTAWEAIPAAATPTVITVADTTDSSCSVALFESATGDLAPKTDGGATYDASSGTLTATAFAGALTGNVTGNASGTAATVTGAAQTAITSLGALTGLTVGSDGTGGDVTFYSDTAGDSMVWDASEEKLTITGTNSATALDIADGNVTVADDLAVTGAITGGSVVAPIAINAQTGTTYTFVAADAGKLVTSSNGSAQTFTVPPNSSVAFDVGTQIIVQNIGSANCTLAQGSGVTITSVDSNKEIDGQYASACLIKTATDAWTLIGKLK
tara:strand:+ start:1715 stop:2728 length:1014 start_codon:yes stop_codon:yes gene_type:complete